MGRPPSSGYCGTCRKRRIKCDKTRPSCQRCAKSGYVCKGYDLGLRIQSLVVVTEPDSGSQRLARIVVSGSGSSGPPPLKLSSARSESVSSSSSSSSTFSTSGGLLTPPDSSSDEEHGHHLCVQQTTTTRRRRVLNPPPEMNLSAFQEHIAFSYFFSTYGWAYFWKPFLQLARESELAPTASHMCSLALAYGHMGIGKGDQKLKSMGLQLYGRSLREVQTLLSQGAEARKELARLCVPIVILGMYSFAIDEDLRLIHNLGVAQILMHCGPQAFQEEPLLTAYRSCRALLICQSFATRRRTFLEEEQWKTIPWTHAPKTALDSLIDILADMPGIINDMAASEAPISPSTKRFFHTKVTALRADLQAWRWMWHDTHPDVAHVVPSNLHNLHEIETGVFKELLATRLEFESTQQALEMLTYNAGLIYLMQLEDLLGMHIDRPHNAPLTPNDEAYILEVSTRHPLLLPGEARSICQPALEAFRLIPSLYNNLVTSRDRIMVILAPLGIVYCSTRRHAELNRCMQSILDEVPFFGGGNARRDLSVYELALGRAWGSAEPCPIPSGTTSGGEVKGLVVI